SCRSDTNGWNVATQRWQCITTFAINEENLNLTAEYCSEFLIHAADVEGLCQGIDLNLVQYLGKHAPIPCTYAGGANSIDDLKAVDELSNGSVDLTYGSALDIFGGTTVKYDDCVTWNQNQ
ncbi:MAG: phosphoribosylformimino-5-aminoimidazole carboxamide ribotide isomerase, partial [Planctomycetes bacterium]|nr:phosphoribosylformimino-5-aminoimidazole carboxamide ribotide isomerase [Planctomycetota bacterium]